jgi:hypothetical protein
LAIVLPNLNSAAITLVSSAIKTPFKLLVSGYSENNTETDKETISESKGSKANQEV